MNESIVLMLSTGKLCRQATALGRLASDAGDLFDVYGGFLDDTESGAKPVAVGCVLKMDSDTSKFPIFKQAKATTTGPMNLVVSQQHLPATLLSLLASTATVKAPRRIGTKQLAMHFNTTGAALGDFVFLQDTVSSDGENIGLTAGTIEIPVGRVTKVGGSGVGMIWLNPDRAATEYGLAKHGRLVSGNITITEANTSGTATVPAAISGGRAVATMKSTDGSTNYVKSASISSTTLTVTLDTAPGAGKTTVVSYIAHK
jgi:hypothetical protein